MIQRDRSFGPNVLLELFIDPLDPGYADAALARAEHGPRPVWAGRAAQAAQLVTLALIAFLLVVAYRLAVAAAP